MFTCLLVLPAVLAAVGGSPGLYGSAVELSLPSHYYPEAFLTTPELVVSRGYPAESHTVITEDGYILTIHRIPHGKAGPSAHRRAVLLQHGLLCSSSIWLLPENSKALGFVLADAGYDVWLGNSRGNKYSNKHVKYNYTDSRYWQFSWHESGVYDLPAMIDYILQRTGQRQLLYVGHSMGNTMFYVMASMRPEYNVKIRAQFSLAPVAFMTNLRSRVIRLLALFDQSIVLLLKFIGVDEFTPNNDFVAAIAAVLCPDGAPTQVICSNILFMLFGYDKEQFNTTSMPIILGHFPSSGSKKQLLHYGQEIKSRRFRQYDHGVVKNLLTYGSAQPPDYDLSKVTADIYLYWSDNDWLAAAEDVKELERKLPNVRASTRVPYNKFNHLDYLWAIDVVPLLYNDLLGKLATN